MTDSSYTHIAVVADRSGSMATIEKDMNGGLKTFLEDQRKEPGTLTVDITTFDTTVETPNKWAAVDDIKFPVIVPRGGTALYDALGQTVVSLGESLAALPEERRPGKVIVLVVTDGQENSSREYRGKPGADAVKALVETQREDFQWEFIFLGANIDSFDVAGGLGFAQGSTINYGANSGDVSNVLRAASAYVTTTRSGIATSFTQKERDESVANLKK